MHGQLHQCLSIDHLISSKHSSKLAFSATSSLVPTSFLSCATRSCNASFIIGGQADGAARASSAAQDERVSRYCIGPLLILRKRGVMTEARQPTSASRNRPSCASDLAKDATFSHSRMSFKSAHEMITPMPPFSLRSCSSKAFICRTSETKALKALDLVSDPAGESRTSRKKTSIAPRRPPASSH